jgi:HK97 family phage prohead protease
MPLKFKNPQLIPKAPVGSLIGKTVFFSSPEHEGQRFAGMVSGVNKEKGTAVIRMAIPNSEGILMVSDSITEVRESDVRAFDGFSSESKIRHFDARLDINTDGVSYKRAKVGGKYQTIKDTTETDVIEDYLDVTISGYASTFQDATPSDRDGDYVVAGAFSDTITDFKKNPVMLTDHRNRVKHLAGSFGKIGQDQRGLYVEGTISNAPGLIDVRYKLVEKHLKALSIGGLFMYREDGRGIERVILYEITLCPVPANQDALVTTRSLDMEDMVKAYNLHRSKSLKIKGATK